MYCLNCGKIIPESSKFCTHCGQNLNEIEPSLEEQIAKGIIEKEITKQVIEAHKSSLKYQFLKRILGWYFAWIALHLLILLIFSEGIFDNENLGSGKFWPFGRYVNIGNYDITEFLVYTISPFAIILILSMVRNEKKENREEEKPKNSGNEPVYDIMQFDKIFVKVIIFIIIVLLLILIAAH